MRKIYLMMFVLFLVTYGCSKPSDLEMVYNPVKGLSSGAWQAAAITEATTNFSSLLYDKTEASFERFAVNPFTLIPAGSTFYIIPTKYTDQYNKVTYDDRYAKMMASYLIMNNYGKVVKDVENADYVMILDVVESLEMLHGKNHTSITVSIQDSEETPLFFAYAKVVSKSDNNFYYYPSKNAKPVKYLTLKGFEKILTEAMPRAFS